jgi:hypothetical protein
MTEVIEVNDVEISVPVADEIASWQRIIEGRHNGVDARVLLRNAAIELWQTLEIDRTVHPESHAVARQEVVDALEFMAEGAGVGPDDAQAIFAEAFRRQPPSLSTSPLTSLPLALAAPPLTIAEWLARDLPEPDYIMGSWLTTTSRALLVAATGLGKTNVALALGLHIAAGADFLHWRARRPCRVLYIDGEMSRRLLKQRIAEAVARLGQKPAGFHALSAEDVEGFAPLNTAAGQACIDRLIKQIGGVDFVVFDAIMCLLAGDMKDGEMWGQVMPWVRALTKRNVGQLWIHHTGHDESRSYGDKTREWQLDTVIHMEAVGRLETDVSFSLEFRKARERTPKTRADFQTTRITLIGNVWQSEATATARKGHVSPLSLKFLDALNGALASDQAVKNASGQRAATTEVWKAECVLMGLIDPKAKPDSARTLFAKHRRDLISAHRAVGEGDLTWT